MPLTAIDLMREHVRAIYRAATGADFAQEDPGEKPEDAGVDLDEVRLRFADLEAMARGIPEIAERVPPFSFRPMVDLMEGEKEWIVDVTVPGVDPEDVCVEIAGDTLILSGSRSGGPPEGHDYLLAEIPRGPFSRTVSLPRRVEQDPVVEFRNGTMTIRLQKPAP
jgi:HSP20 family protein